MRSTRRRAAANLLSLVALAFILVLGSGAKANPLAIVVAQQALISGPNQGNPEPQRTASTPIGTIPGSFWVDDRGAARVSIPLDVPPAARGLQPNISFAYDSQLGNGPLGVGWRLGGLSAITRCPHTLADDGEVAAVGMSNNDALCLDGERLMLIEGTAFEIGAIYRPKRDDFSRVEIVAGSSDTAGDCHGGYGFEARRRDGTISLYGCMRDATLSTHLGPRTWSLSRVRDRFGNAIDYRYNYETAPVFANGDLIGEADVEHHLGAIDYGGHVELHPATRHVRLEWEDRPDPQTGYFLGAPQQQSKRLSRVSTFGPDGLVYRYELDYDTPSITGRSLLHAVRQCDAEGVCRPDTIFDWELGELAVEPLGEGSNFSNLAHWPYMDQDAPLDVGTPLVLDQTILDANGDGRTDMLLAVGDHDAIVTTGRGWELWTSQPASQTNPGAICGSSHPDFQACAETGRFVVHESARSGSLAAPTQDDLSPAVPAIFATDYDGDGRDDAIAIGPNNLALANAPPGGTRFYIAQSLPDGGVEQFEFNPDANYIWWFTASDQTGDGLGDLLFCAGKPQLDAEANSVSGTGTWQFVPNIPGEGFDAANRIETGIACSAYDKFLQLDHDGDGLASLLVIPVWDTDAGTWIPSQEWTNYHALRLDPLDDWAASLEDSGLPPDLAQRWRPSITAAINNNFLVADFPQAEQGFGADKILDVNADGLDDILRYELDIGDTPAQLDDVKAALFGDPDEWGGVRIWLNTGAGFIDGGWLMQADDPGDYFFRRFLAAGTLDYDADGRLDYLTPVDDPQSNSWSWSIWTSNGDGTFVEHPQVIEAPFDDMTLVARTMGAFDLDGDGLHDPGVFHPPGWTLWEHAGAVPDKLVGIEDGLGAWTQIEYRSLTDFDGPAELFEIDLDACTYPERCERNPRIVVARHDLDSGITGQPRAFEHRYGIARSDREGRRGLGFEHHEVIEWADVDGMPEPIHRHAVYYGHGYDPELHDFPFAGLPRFVIDDARDPATGRHRISVDGRSHEYIQTTAHTYHSYVAQRVARVHEPPSCADVFCDAFLELDESTLVSGVVDTVFQVDEYGNPLVRTESADTGPSTLTYRYETQYKNDPESWLLGLPTHQQLHYLETGVPQRERETQSYYFPETGALQARITEPADVELYLHETFGYDAHGNLVAHSAVDANAEIRASSVGYDEHGVFPISSTNALGHVSSMRWDAGLGVAIEARDPNDLRIVADYDGLGHLTGLRSFAGNVPRGDDTTLSYAALAPDGDGPIMEIRANTDGHGYVASEFDRLARVVTERELSLDGIERYVALDYDARDRLRAASLPTPKGQAPPGWELHDYDFADRLVKRTLPDGTFESWAHHGLELEHVDIGGSVSLLRHDTAARLVESIRGLGTPDEERLCFDYGAFELLERVRPDCIGREPLDISNGEAPPTVKSFVYDDLGQLVASHDPSEGARSYFYNGHGDLAAYVDGNGNEVTLTRDLLGRVAERHDLDGLTTWTWDATFLGELATSKSPSGHAELVDYDDFGRVSIMTKIIGGESFDLTFEYDDFDRLSEIHYPLADEAPEFWVRNIYAQNGQLRAVRSGVDNTLLWRAESLSDEGQLTAERFGDHTLTQRDYDPLRGFVRSIRTTSNLGGTLQDLDYQWNQDGTLHRRRDLLHQQSEVMGYDALHRVLEVDTVKQQQSHARNFAYDSLGNLVYASDRGENDYDQNGRLAVADGSSYAWDQNGNLVARVGQDPATLSYTAFDKIAELETASDTTLFEYDAAQDRVYRYAAAEGKETIYVGDLYQRHSDDDDGEVEHHYFVPGLERIVANVVDHVGPITVERSVHYIHVDHLGSTDVISDGSGLVEQRMSYDAWGKRRDPENWTLPDEFAELDLLNLGYTGHEAQEDAGLINMGGRMYDPHLGRMASADPLVVDPTSTQGWNRYAYVLNRPLALIDPSGFEPTEPGESGEASGHPGGDSGVMGTGESTKTPASESRRDGGSSQPKPQATPEAEQRPGDNGPGTASPPPMDLWQGFYIGDFFGPDPNNPIHAIGKTFDGIIDTRQPETNPSQERRRIEYADVVANEIVHRMQNPPAYVAVSVELTLFLIGGDIEMAGAVIKGVRTFAVKRAATKAATKAAQKRFLPMVAGTVKNRGKKRGAANGPRAYKPHTRGAKRNARQESSGLCPKCGIEMTPPTRRVKGSKVNPAEAQGDHIYPRSKGGDGATVQDMSNIEIMCATCNINKGTRIP